MTKRIRSVDFLPEIFQTPTNKKFLNSTLDQLIQEPKLKQTQGYIGRQSAPGKAATDGYVIEPTDRRTNYQLEPGVIFKDEGGNTDDALSYMGLLDGLQTAGANVDDHDRLFRSDTYSWSPLIDFDKFVNYSQYFWLPEGPDSVSVQAANVFLTNDFDVTANDENFTIDGFGDTNPAITVLRGGSYNFNVNENGAPFYIQTQPGVDGVMPWADNISSREVLGVTNNGDDDGTVLFTVPLITAQDFYHNLPDIGDVDFAVTDTIASIDGLAQSVVGDIAGIQDIENKTIVFLTDPLAQGQVYRLQFGAGVDPIVTVVPDTAVAIFDRFDILYGDTYSGFSFFRNSGGNFEKVPLETASLDTLYYQDATNPDRFGVISVVDQTSSAALNINSIVGRETYTSPNGVVFTNGLKVQFSGTIIPAEFAGNEYYVEGVGTGIILVPVTDLVVPEPYATSASVAWDINPWDASGMDGTLNAPFDLDYLTINRASIDLNAWTRSNRWFHIDVINATAEYNNSVVTTDNANRASRPIIEFEANLRLFNYGTIGKPVINAIDYDELDALSNINGASSYTIDGYQLVNGSRVIFANDTDPTAQNKIFRVETIDPNNDGNTVLNLILADDADSEVNDIVVIATGLTQQGKVYTFDGTDWIESQAKLDVNQAPLFNIFDRNGNSLSDFASYPSTNFAGSKLFSYAPGTGSDDAVLGFPLTYLNINNLGDIVFENNLYTDTFLYVENDISYENSPISAGVVQQYSDRTTYTEQIGWVRSIEESHQAQIFDMDYAGEAIELDVIPKTGLLVPAVRITAGGAFVNPSDYTVVGNTITFLSAIADGTELQIKVISDDISATGYYEVPTNLASNMFNENITQLTLGTVRNHFNALAQTIIDIEGEINGSNNIRDLGEISQYGNLIVQQSSPIALAAMFMRKKEYNFFSAVEFNSRQYEKFKNRLVDWVEKHDVYDMTPNQIIEAAIKEINIGKNIDSSFYWSDMMATGEDFESTEYLITPISDDTFATINAYDFTKANTQAILVYHNDTLLIKDIDYTVATDGARITLLITPVPDDTITINEYSTTLGANVPSTPTKLGLYPKYEPMIFLDDTYSTPTYVIRGHDGSLTVAHGDGTADIDARDAVLFEFEKRVYNNIKVNDVIPIEPSDIIPGAFRTTDYTQAELTEIMSSSLLSWLGWNRIDYKRQDYNQAEEKTWNYSTASSKITGEVLEQGHWRGIYKSYYDTDAPHVRPWEMVGLTERPIWWTNYYGPAPYTSGNLVLWDDMEAGLIREPGNNRTIDKYKRPGLTTVLPVDGEGNLVMPLASVIDNYTQYDFKKSWAIGDNAPAENAWTRSSAYPYAMQTLYALTKPAQYFALMADRDRYVYNEAGEQYLYDERYRIDARAVDILDADNVKHSYINWIVDYNSHFGYNSRDALITDLANLDVSLCHHMASFTDKNNLKIFTDKSSPDSTNSSLLLPDESFKLLFYKNQPTDEVIYSSLIVQKTADGYAVIGNSFTNPYFTVQTPVQTGKYTNISVGRTAQSASTVRIPIDFTDNIERIPYGHVFTTKQAVATFISSYNHYLVQAGFMFEQMETDQEVNWNQMIQEFLYWADQGWAVGSVVNLNPAATELEFEREMAIVDDLGNLELTEQPLNQNREPLDISDYTVDRVDNNFKIRMIDNNNISYLKFNLTNFEHLLILDNISIFNDLIYDPVTGVRQQRVKLSGFTTFDWNGQLDAPGFLFNEDNVKTWSEIKTYNKGDIVKFKNSYWSADDKVQPSDTFDFGQWVKTDYDKINKGLLPNLATKAEQQLQYYNNKTANLESDIDLMAYGLTGYRSRDYLQSLDLDDISQVNIYGDMIANKGTARSLNLFKNVTLTNEPVDYSIFENWAIKRAQYGASSSRSYVELKLDGDVLTASPGLIEIVDSKADASEADLLLPVSQIYKQSEKNTDKNIFPIVVERNLDTSLPTAGFVNAYDVDLAVFELSDVDVAADTSDGSITWVAKDTETDWNVYRTIKLDAIIISVTDNLDGTLTLVTNVPHNVVAEDSIVVTGVDDLVDGTFTVQSVSESIKIVIPGELQIDQTCLPDTNGTILKFESARVESPAEIAGTIFDNNLFTTEKVWVDSVNGKSATYTKTQPFALTRTEDNPLNTSTAFGTSVAQGYNSNGLLVGDPALEVDAITDHGAAYLYNKNGQLDYTFGVALTLTNHPEVIGYGTNVALVNEYGAITAPGNASKEGVVAIVNRNRLLNFITETQLLRDPAPTAVATGGFGTSVAMSKDENWIVVGEPNKEKVHTYQRLDYEAQNVSFISDGVQTVYDISNDVIISAANEVNVVVGGVAVAFTYVSPNITLTATPTLDDVITISRKDQAMYTGDGFITTFSVLDLYARTDIDSLIVTVSDVLQRPGTDYNLVGDNIVFTTTAPPVDTINPINVSISLGTTFRYVDEILAPVGAIDFGTEVDISDNGSHIVVTAPSTNSSAGEAYIYNRVFERTVISDPIQLTYSSIRTALGSVFKNGVRLTSGSPAANLTPDYTIAGNVVTPNAALLNVGDFLDIDTTEFKLIQTVTAATPTTGALFGNAVSICKSKCSVYFGAPFPAGEGSVIRFVNNSRISGIITSSVQNPVIPASSSIRINNIEVQLPVSGTSQDAADAINAATTPNVIASAANGYLTIELINKEVRSIANKLDIFPGETITLGTLGLEPYTIGQTITSPIESTTQSFGSSIHIDLNLNQLVVGAVDGDVILDNAYTADNDNPTVDTEMLTTDLATVVENTGVVYTYDLLPGAETFDIGKLVFGQEIYTPGMSPNDSFGNAVNLVDGVLVVGSVDKNGEGSIAIFGNTNNTLCWTASNVQNDTVDVDCINSTYIYDSETLNVNRYLDYIDPLNGKILGAAQQNIDYITVYDPTVYNDTNVGLLWGPEQVGKIWWDVSSVRFLDYNLSDAKYASKQWGNVFPGSSVDVYQWIESTEIPSDYTGTGTVIDVDKFVSLASVDRSGLIQTKYYYWVNQVETISNNSEKTLSASAIASYIESPATSGISYAAFIARNLVGLYNCKDILTADTSVLHVEYDKIKNDDNVFVEYDLFRENHPTDFLSDSLYKKFLDSFCGVDSLGNLVPDVGLSPTDRYGIEFRPRKSMFVDRTAALTSYMLKINGILAKYTMAEGRSYPLLDSEEAQPLASSGEWDQALANIEELSFQDYTIGGAGWKYLIESDSTRNGLWSIYEVTPAEDDVTLYRVQSYDTKRFWTLETWAAEDFSLFTKVDYVVQEFSALVTLGTVENNAIAKVLTNSIGNWEIYRNDDGAWTRVALENGTIQITSTIWDFQAGRYGWDVEVWDAQNNDEEPVIEMRQILRSINEELLIGDLSTERSVGIMSVFNYILSEQPHVDWLFKTSLIDVSQNVRGLNQYAVYQKDNQDYLIDYIKEAKPYHTKIKDFLISYDGQDLWDGQVTDFDCPSVYDAAFGQYISPILDDGAILVTDPSNKQADDDVWQTTPWDQWFNNYLLTVDDVVVTNPGTGYTIAPQVVVTGASLVPAEMVANVVAGSITSISITNPGSGYADTPVITFTGGNGTDAAASAIVGNNLVRTLKTTIKYDRFEYETSIVEWTAIDTPYLAGQLVKVNSAVYRIVDTAAALTFDPTLHELVPAEELSGIDRTFGYYEADVNSPGLDLSLLIGGISYPGVEVQGIPFDEQTGGIDPEGFITYSEDLIDTIYESAFLDSYYGDAPGIGTGDFDTGPTAIDVDGGEFIDTYHSHAPEELVPGAMFDTLDIKVFSRPGSDYNNDGHAYDIQGSVYTATSAIQSFSFDGLVDLPIKVLVANGTTGKMLYETVDFTVDWTNLNVDVTGMTIGDDIKVFVYEIGGGNQLHRNTLLGSETTAGVFNVPVLDTEIYDTVIFVDGVLTAPTGIAYVDNQTSAITIPAPSASAFITVTVFGTGVPQYEESYPVLTTELSDGSTTGPDVGAELTGKHKHNAVVEVEGLRLRPPEVGRHIALTGQTDFFMPAHGGYLYDSVLDNEVDVYLNNTLLTLGVDFTVSPPNPSAPLFGSATFGSSVFGSTGGNTPRYITLTVPAAADEIVEVYVRTAADYWWTGTTLTFNTAPTLNDRIAVTTFKDDSELDIFTQVFEGPTVISTEIIEAYDAGLYDAGLFDGLTGATSYVNVFTIDRPLLTNANRLWVTVNGERLHSGTGYQIINGNQILLTVPVIQATDIVAVSSITENVITDGVNFRLFKDMRDTVGMYKMTSATTLTQDLLYNEDTIHVTDASVLGQPNLAIAKFGIVIINGERITYRERDLVANTVSGLRRGTAGTGGVDYREDPTLVAIPIPTRHVAGNTVYDVSSNSLVPDTARSARTGTSLVTDFDTALDTTIEVHDASKISTRADGSGEIEILGLIGRHIAFTSLDLITNEVLGVSIVVNDTYVPLEDIPDLPALLPAGQFVRGLTQDTIWYAQGTGTASNGIALQDQNTVQAIFIK